jgi:hypothetical protein
MQNQGQKKLQWYKPASLPILSSNPSPEEVGERTRRIAAVEKHTGSHGDRHASCVPNGKS